MALGGELTAGSTDYGPPRELSLYNAGIRNMSEVVSHGRTLSELIGLRSLSLHSNALTRMDGLQALTHLRHLDLSSNQLSVIEGLSPLLQLKTLNLSCNLLRDLHGLGALTQLESLDVSHNEIGSLSGLAQLHGPRYALARLDVQGNRITSASELLVLSGLPRLRVMTFARGNAANPVCAVPGYRSRIFAVLPTLTALDSTAVDGRPVDVSGPVPGMDDYMQRRYIHVAASGTAYAEELDGEKKEKQEKLPPLQIPQRSHHDTLAVRSGRSLSTPMVDRALERHRNRQRLASAAATAEVPQQGSKAENAMTVIVPASLPSEEEVDAPQNKQHQAVSDEERRIVSLEQQLLELVAAINTTTTATNQTAEEMAAEEAAEAAAAEAESVLSRKSSEATSAASACSESDTEEGEIVAGGAASSSPPMAPSLHTAEAGLGRELAAERARRLAAERAATRLLSELRAAQERNRNHGSKYRATVSMIVRLEQALTDAAKRVARVQEDAAAATRERDVAQAEARRAESEAAGRSDLLAAAGQRQTRLEAASAELQARLDATKIEQAEAVRAAELKAATAEGEVDVYREAMEHSKAQRVELQELLALREKEHARISANLVHLEGPEVAARIAEALADQATQHDSERAKAANALADKTEAYAELEREFRRALHAEAARYHQIQTAYAALTKEATAHRRQVEASEAKEQSVARTVTELAQLVKDQRTLLAAARSETASARGSAETAAACETRMQLELEAISERVMSLQQERDALQDKVIAQESVILGLRNERELWGRELAAQGAQLATDRGRLQLAAETAQTETSALKHQLTEARDAVRIKTKMLEDQADSLRKLKTAVAERGRELQMQQEEASRRVADLEDRLEAERGLSQQLQEDIEAAHAKKTSARQQLETTNAALELAQREAAGLRASWQDTGTRLGQVEGQVDALRRSHVAKEDESRRRVDGAEAALRRVEMALKEQREAADSAIKTKDTKIAALAQELEACTAQLKVERQSVDRAEAEVRELLRAQARERESADARNEKLRAVLAELQV